LSVYKNIVDSSIPIIMGIVNVTPDSFSDGGKYNSTTSAINHAVKLIIDGADIIDIGGQSTKPGSKSVNINEELERVIPVINGILKEFPKTIISVDTSKSNVAEHAVKAGARLINDISGGTFDPLILNVASKYDLPFVIMHIKGIPQNMQDDPIYEDVIAELSKYFEERIKIARKNNVNKLILDPGVGFGKRVEDNFTILNNLNQFSVWNFPILVGVSKKSFIGKSLNLDIDHRENATSVAETIAIMNGAKLIRTHNVKNAVEIKKMYSSLIGNKTS